MSTSDAAAAAPDAVQLAAVFSLSTGVSEGWILPPGEGERSSTVMLRRSCRDIDGSKSRSFLQTHSFSRESGWSGVAGFPLEISGAVIFSPSPSGRRLAIVREDSSSSANTAPNAPKAYMIELWDRGAGESAAGLLCRVPTYGAHEKIMGDTWFGGFAWAPDERQAVYVAQRPAPKTRSFFTCDPAKASAAAGEQFIHRQDWGEKFDGVSDLGLFLLDFEGGFVAEIPGVPAMRTPGQPAFSPDGGSVVYTTWSCEPRLLGMIYCYQRPCQLWSAPIASWADALRARRMGGSSAASGDAAGGSRLGAETAAAADGKLPEPLPPTHACLTPDARLSRCARFSPSGAFVAWLANDAGFDTHSGCFQLKLARWDAASARTLEERTLVDTVDLPDSAGAFPGLWLDNLPSRCWQPNDSAIFLTTSWGSAQAVVRVDARSGAVTRVSAAEAAAAAGAAAAAEAAGPERGASQQQLPASERAAAPPASASVLCVGEGGVLVAASSPNSPGGVGFVPFDVQGGSYADAAACVRGPRLGRLVPTTTSLPAAAVAAAAAAVAGLRYRVLSVAPEGEAPGSAAAQAFEAILVEPALALAKGSLPPLLVVPHGGPHGVITTDFFPSYAFLAAMHGFAILYVNFRGSTGFGAAALETLPGRIGTADVADVVAATEAALALQPPVADRSRVGVVGGSHGGFLAAHLTAQHPDLFKAAALRNPVTDVASMSSASDIPDWCFIEALGIGSYDFAAAEPPTAAQLARMREVSPVAHAADVRAPTLVLLGAKDRRVPAFQGRLWFHMLRARGVPAKLLEYPEDVHAIDKPASEADHWLHISRWMEEHLRQ